MALESHPHRRVIRFDPTVIPLWLTDPAEFATPTDPKDPDVGSPRGARGGFGGGSM